jgi:hypothetical protein
MLKDIESEDAVKTPIPKRQLMRIADDIGVFEDLMLEFDASWVLLRGRTRSDVKNNAIAFAQELLEISTDLVGYVVGRNGDYVFLDEKRDVILDSIGDAASIALQPAASGTQSTVAGGTTDKTGNVLIHSIEPAGFAPPANVCQPPRAFSERRSMFYLTLRKRKLFSVWGNAGTMASKTREYEQSKRAR